MMRSRLSWGLYALVSGLTLPGCVWQQVALTEAGDSGSRKRVLIATEKTQFKDAVVAALVQGLVEDGCYVKVLDVQEMTGQPTEQYGAIVILNSCWFMSLDHSVGRFLTAVLEGEKDKIILVTTTNLEWKADVTDVDAISSASQMATAGTLADTLRRKVQAILVRRVRP